MRGFNVCKIYFSCVLMLCNDLRLFSIYMNGCGLPGFSDGRLFWLSRWFSFLLDVNNEWSCLKFVQFVIVILHLYLIKVQLSPAFDLLINIFSRKLVCIFIYIYVC
jgi:hypothetical protein